MRVLAGTSIDRERDVREVPGDSRPRIGTSAGAGRATCGVGANLGVLAGASIGESGASPRGVFAGERVAMGVSRAGVSRAGSAGASRRVRRGPDIGSAGRDMRAGLASGLIACGASAIGG
ncbi:MAG: hypothetical protein ACK5XO_09440 [Phycisphaerales bacterium]